MPIYQYVCVDCDHAFEDLIFGDEQPRCPRCESGHAEKQFSVFATRSASVADPPTPGPCGTCGDPRGPGAYSM